jgi:hypothetical protein
MHFLLDGTSINRRDIKILQGKKKHEQKRYTQSSLNNAKATSIVSLHSATKYQTMKGKRAKKQLLMVHRFYNGNRLLEPHRLLHPSSSHHSAKFLIVNSSILGQANDQHQEDGRNTCNTSEKMIV